MSEEEKREQPSYYAVLPASVRYDRELSPAEKIFFAEVSALSNKQGYCSAKNSYFCELYGVSDATVRRWVSKLERQGYITSELTRGGTGLVTGRRIRIAAPQPAQKCADEGAKMSETPAQKCADKNNTRINNNIPPNPPEGATPDDLLFAQFWAAYPSRGGRKGGKREARKVWSRLRVTAKRYSEIMRGLDAYIRSDDVQRGYAMDASRWLRNRRWEDTQTAGEEAMPFLSSGLTASERLEDFL